MARVPRRPIHPSAWKKETVRKAYEARGTWPLRGPKQRYSARFGPGMPTKSSLGALLAPLFGQFQSEILGSSRLRARPLSPGPIYTYRTVPERDFSSVPGVVDTPVTRNRYERLRRATARTSEDFAGPARCRSPPRAARCSILIRLLNRLACVELGYIPLAPLAATGIPEVEVVTTAVFPHPEEPSQPTSTYSDEFSRRFPGRGP